VAAAILLVVLIVLLLPDNSEDGVDGEAIETGSDVTLEDTTTTSTTDRPTTTREATTTTEEATTTTTEATPTTNPSPTSTPATPTSGPTQTTPPPPPPPAELTVTYPRDSQGRMLLTEGGQSAVIINNVGGQTGAWAVSAAGDVTVLGAGNGTIEAGAVIQVRVQASEDPGPTVPHGTVTVSGDNGVIVSIPVVIT
jgi:hypothetical protein